MVLFRLLGGSWGKERAPHHALCTILSMQRPHASETKRLIELLHRPVSFWESSKKHRVGTLALISETRDPAVIPDIVLLLLDRDRDVARSAASAVSALVEVLRPEDLPWLDHV